MFVKNRILDKIIQGYLIAFSFFSLIATNVVLDNWLNSIQLYNRLTAFMIFLITLSSHLGLIAMNYADAKEKKEG